MSQTLRAVIVDDERLARQQLRALLAAHPEIEVVGEADGVQQAIEVIHLLQPDVIFLDIQMPGPSGFDLVAALEIPGQIIFVTAFDEYAVRAFEVNALDYLLKPVHPDRLKQALERLAQPQLSAPAVAPSPLEYDDRIFLDTGTRASFVKVSDIECIAAAGTYSEVYTADGKKILLLKSLNEWETRLPGKHFMRIHRSALVNLEYVEKVDQWFGQTYRVHLRGLAEPLTISRRYAARLKGKFK